MTTQSTIEEAIARSVSNNETVCVEVSDLAAALVEVSINSDDYDHATLEDGDGKSYEDVWGTTEDGGDFRLRLNIA